MNTYTPGQKVTITLDPEYAEGSSLMAAPAAVFEATYERKANVEDVEDVHRVTYVNRHGEHVSRIVFDSEVSAA